jgi:hypothetical protein
MNSDRYTIDVVLPKDKLNDYRFIQLQLLDAKCNTLDYLSRKINVPMKDLVDKYLPELNCRFHKALYEKYNIPRD